MIDKAPVVVEIDFEKALTYSKEELRNLILALEDKLKDAPQIEIPLTHYFSKGVYGREINFDKGSLLVGKIHKHQTMNVISKGEVSVISVDGVIRAKAPFTFVSSPGAKRVIFAHEDSTWTTFHGTHETDLEKIEEEFIAKNYDEVEEIQAVELGPELKETQCLG